MIALTAVTRLATRTDTTRLLTLIDATSSLTKTAATQLLSMRTLSSLVRSLLFFLFITLGLDLSDTQVYEP